MRCATRVIAPNANRPPLIVEDKGRIDRPSPPPGSPLGSGEGQTETLPRMRQGLSKAGLTFAGTLGLNPSADAGRGGRRGLWCAEFEALNLAGGCLGQLRHKLDPARALV